MGDFVYVKASEIDWSRILFVYQPIVYMSVADQSVARFGHDNNRYPHTCPRCASAAYVGLNSVECSRKNCS